MAVYHLWRERHGLRAAYDPGPAADDPGHYQNPDLPERIDEPDLSPIGP